MSEDHEIEHLLSDASPHEIALSITDELRKVGHLTTALDNRELARSLNDTIVEADALARLSFILQSYRR